MRICRLRKGRVLHLVDERGWSVCGRHSLHWQFQTYGFSTYRPCRLCAKGDRLRMPT